MGIKIEEINTDKPKQLAWLNTDVSLGTFVFKNKEKENFYTELALLLNSGVNLITALEIQANDQKKQQHKALLFLMSSYLIQGDYLHIAMKKLSKHFSPYEVISIQIGEETGSLALIFEKLGTYYQKKNKQSKAVKNAMIYPIVIAITAIFSIFFMLNFVVPMFADIFMQNQLELPWITQKIILLSSFVSSNFYTLIILTLLSVLSVYVLVKNNTMNYYFDRFLLKIPIVSSFVKKNALLQFTQTLALLSAAKVPILTSVQLIYKMVAFTPLKQGLKKVENAILEGESLSSGLAKHYLFENRIVSLVKVAEETNNNEYVFERLSQQYANELENQSKNLTTLMEPLIIIVLGGLVAIVLVAMYLPMFKLSTAIG